MATRSAWLVCTAVCFFGLWGQYEAAGACQQQAWFGPDCVFACQCAFWNKCDKERGHCSLGGCKPGLTGTACQYADVAYHQQTEANFTVFAGLKNLAFAVDGNNETCFAEEGQSNLPLSVDIAKGAWVNAISILLYKDFVDVGTGANTNDLEVTTLYNDGSMSEVLQPYPVQPNDSWVNYHLPQPAAVTRVQIRAVGSKSLALCEVIVLGGRNMAIKKAVRSTEASEKDDSERGGIADSRDDGSASERLNDDEGDESSRVSLVVDGDNQSCFRDENMARGAKRSSVKWIVSLGSHVNIWRVKVHSTEQDTSRPEFRVNVTLSPSLTEVEVLRHDDTATPPAAPGLTHFLLAKPEASTEVTVWVSHPGSGSNAHLELCEVEIIGDCVDGYYGWDCEKRCKCKDPAEICDKLFGDCPQSRCAGGYRGDDCQEKRDDGIDNGHDDDHHFDGDYDDDHHFDGDMSNTNCSHCLNNSCNVTTGRCLAGCVEGTEGEQCEENLPSKGNDAAEAVVNWTLLGGVVALMVM